MNYTQYLMVHTTKTIQPIHIYSTKSEESSRRILSSSLLCLSNHPNIWWFNFTWVLQYTQSQAQLAKGAKKLTLQDKNAEPGVRIQIQVSSSGR